MGENRPNRPFWRLVDFPPLIPDESRANDELTEAQSPFPRPSSPNEARRPKLLSGFRCRRLNMDRSAEADLSPSTSHMVYNVLRRVRFYPWTAFDRKVVDTADMMEKAFQELPHSTSPCQCRDDRCAEDWCRRLALHKLRVFDRKIGTEGLLRSMTFDLLETLNSFLLKYSSGHNLSIRQQEALYTIDPHVDDEEEPIDCEEEPIGWEGKGLELVPDFLVFDDNREYPESTIEVKLPHDFFFAIPTSAWRTSRSTQIWYDGVNMNMQQPDAQTTSDWLVNVTSQAILQALNSRSGYGCVWMYETAVMLRVRPKMNNGYIDVDLSSVYPCNGMTSAYHALLTFLAASHEDSSDSNHDDLANILYEMQHSDVNSMPVPVVQNFAPCGRKNAANRKITGVADGGGTTRSSTSEENQGESDLLRPKAPEDVDNTGCREGRAEVNMERKKWDIENAIQAMEEGVLMELTAQENKDIFKARCREHFASGGSGVVTIGRVGKFLVALKCWSEDSAEGLKCLKNEIDIYKQLYSRHSSLFGAVLPRVFAVCSGPEATGLALALEFVGESIFHRVTNIGSGWEELRREWYMGMPRRWGNMRYLGIPGGPGNVRLSDRDRLDIEEESMKGLHELRACGVLHGDASFRNLRVSYSTLKNSSCKSWRIWWIDLGHCRLTENTSNYALRPPDWCE